MVKDKSRFKIGIIGFGHMGQALYKGLKNAGFKNIISSKTENNKEVFEKADWIFLSVKPVKVSEVLNRISVQSKEKLLISLAAGFSLKKLQQLVKGKNIKVIRIMPSLAISTGSGVIGMYGKNQQLKQELALLGEVVEVLDENDLDILTIISGCSPAILAYFALSFAQFSGKPEKVIIKSLIGSLKYIEDSGLTFHQIIEAVATRGGITENILNFLEEKKVKQNLELGLTSGYQKLERMQKDV